MVGSTTAGVGTPWVGPPIVLVAARSVVMTASSDDLGGFLEQISRTRLEQKKHNIFDRGEGWVRAWVGAKQSTHSSKRKLVNDLRLTKKYNHDYLFHFPTNKNFIYRINLVAMMRQRCYS